MKNIDENNIYNAIDKTLTILENNFRYGYGKKIPFEEIFKMMKDLYALFCNYEKNKRECGKIVIKTHHAGYRRFRKDKTLGHVNLNLTGEITENLLRFVEYLDQVPASAFVTGVQIQTVDELVKHGKLLCRSFRQLVFTAHFFTLVFCVLLIDSVQKWYSHDIFTL